MFESSKLSRRVIGRYSEAIELMQHKVVIAMLTLQLAVPRFRLWTLLE